MPKTDPVWDEIYHRYITSQLTYRQLAEQYGVSFSILCRKGAREHWPQQRRQALRDCANRYGPLHPHTTIPAEEKPVLQEADFEDRLTDPNPKRTCDRAGKNKRLKEAIFPKPGRPAESVGQCEKSENLSDTWANGFESDGRKIVPCKTDSARQCGKCGRISEILAGEGVEPFSKPGEVGQMLNPEPAKETLAGKGVEPFSKTGEVGQTLNLELIKGTLNGEGLKQRSKTEEIAPFVPVGQTGQPELFSEQTLAGLRDLLVQQVHTAFLQLGRRAITEKIHVGVVREPAAPGRSGNRRQKADEVSAAFSDAAEQAARQEEALGLEESAAANAKWKCTYTKDTENIRYVPDDIDVARLKQLSAILRDLYALSDPDDGQKIEVIFAPDTEAWSE